MYESLTKSPVQTMLGHISYNTSSHAPGRDRGIGVRVRVRTWLSSIAHNAWAIYRRFFPNFTWFPPEPWHLYVPIVSPDE